MGAKEQTMSTRINRNNVRIKRPMHILVKVHYLFLIALLSGCGFFSKKTSESPQTPAVPPLSQVPYRANLTIQADKNINADVNGRPSPVALRIFLVAPEVELANKTFEEIFDFNGSEISPRPIKNFILKPGETKLTSLNGMKTQSKLVIAAGFRDPYQTNWLLEKIVDVHTSPSITASISGIAILLE